MKLRVRKGFITQRKGDSITIFDTEKSVLHTFNSTATFIFDRLKMKLDTKEIVSQMVEEFSVSQEKAEQEVNKFIEVLLSENIIAKKTSSK